MVLLAGSLAAQDANRLSVPEDPVAKDRIARAQAALEREQQDRALRILQQVLDGGGDRVVVSQHPPPEQPYGHRFGGVRPSVMSMIRRLPNHGIDRYRKLMEPRARRALDAAVREDDEAAMRECVRRYTLTPSGRRAHLTLTDLLLEQGRFDEARLSAERLRTEIGPEATGQFAAQNLARLALALWGSQRPAELDALVSACEDHLGRTKVSVAGKRRTLSTFVSELAARTALSRPALPPPASLAALEHPRWARSFDRNENYGRLFDMESAGYLPVVPVVDGGVAFFSDGLTLRSADLHRGRPIWPAVHGPQPDFEGSEDPDLRYRIVVDRDLVFAFLQGDPLLDHPWRSAAWSIPSHKLVAVDRATGKVRWSHHRFTGRTPEETEFLSRLSIDQPPLVVDDTLYAAGIDLKGIFQHWVCAFHRDTGHLKWKSYTGAGQTELSRGGNPRRACIPGLLAEHEGVLYYTTSMGVACAVDAVTGAIVWQSPYEQELSFTSRYRGGRWRRYTLPRSLGWSTSRPVFFEDKVFLAPIDSTHLLVADVETGALSRVTIENKPGTSNHHLLGIRAGRLLIAGDQLTALDPATLKPIWTRHLGKRPDGSPHGLPAILGNRVVLTTNTEEGAEIAVFDLITGKLLEKRTLRTPELAGHVVIGNRMILIATAEAVTIYAE